MKTPRHEDEERSESSDRWLVSYADFITLLFAFFTVLYATSERSMEKTEKFQESVKKYLIKAGAFGGSGEKLNQGEKFNTPIEPPIPTYKQGEEKTAEIQNQLETFIDEQLKDEQRQGLILDISSDELGVHVSISAPVIFGSGSTQFKPSALKPLHKLSSFVAGLKRHILIEGHVSANEVRGSQFISAWEFAAARATAFVRYLSKIHHVPAENLAAMSRGAERPFVPVDSAGAHVKNNRMDIVILAEDSPL